MKEEGNKAQRTSLSKRREKKLAGEVLQKSEGRILIKNADLHGLWKVGIKISLVHSVKPVITMATASGLIQQHILI